MKKVGPFIFFEDGEIELWEGSGYNKCCPIYFPIKIFKEIKFFFCKGEYIRFDWKDLNGIIKEYRISPESSITIEQFNEMILFLEDDRRP